jgi:hypothetical protein
MASNDDEHDDQKGDRKPDPPARRDDGQPFGIPVRSLRTVQFCVVVLQSEVWEWKTRPGVPYFRMNGVAVEALKELRRMDRELLKCPEAQRLKREILARGPGDTQVNTRYMQAEIDFWKLRAKVHGMSPAAVLMWAFALIDLEQRRRPESNRTSKWHQVIEKAPRGLWVRADEVGDQEKTGGLGAREAYRCYHDRSDLSSGFCIGRDAGLSARPVALDH